MSTDVLCIAIKNSGETIIPSSSANLSSTDSYLLFQKAKDVISIVYTYNDFKRYPAIYNAIDHFEGSGDRIIVVDNKTAIVDLFKKYGVKDLLHDFVNVGDIKILLFAIF